MTEEQSPARWQLNAVIGLLALVVLLTIVSLGQKWSELSKPAPKWEYAIQQVPDASFVETMNKAGANGWELVSARRATSDDLASNPKPVFYYEMIFRRPATTATFIKGP